MHYLIIIFSILFLTHSVKAEKLTVYTYYSFVSEWGPGPLIEKTFESLKGAKNAILHVYN